METAQQVLIVYGTLSITYGMLLGIPLTNVRMSAPAAPRHLVVAHLSALMQGPLHISLAFALGLSSLSSWMETSAAMLLVGGSSLFVAGATANWRQGIGDHFAARSPGWYLLAASGGPHLVGASVILGGVSVGALT
jgi:hypothetical protein